MSRPVSMEKPAVVAWANQVASTEFKDSRKASIAAEAVGHGLDYVRTMPIGWNLSDSRDTFESNCREHISKSYQPKPFGIFLIPGFGWLFAHFVSSLISWAVKKIVELYFKKE